MAAAVKVALEGVLERVVASSAIHSRPEPRVVAVSKTKSPELVRSAYDNGLRHFGENYAQELAEKANHPLLSTLDDIRWHFIGHLQRNKCNALLSVPHLWMVETVDSIRLATTLNSSCHRKQQLQQRPLSNRLRVMVQVNTSREESKHGCPPESTVELVRHLQHKCAHLEFCGLMTIGAAGHNPSRGCNPDFAALVELKEEVCQSLGLEPERVELSMGMSADFEAAIAAGSTNVRIGCSIFGERQ